MSDAGILLLLYTLAVVILMVEIFLPSHGILTIVGLGLLIAGVTQTFRIYGEGAGLVAVLASVIGLPLFAVITVKVWPDTKIGRMIAPPNPVYTAKELGTDHEDLDFLLGTKGRAVTPLRPVGTCEFNGKRVQCVSESGMLDTGAMVQAVGFRGRNLEVAPVDESRTT